MKNIAIILSSGTGTRSGLDIPKQFLKIAGKTVLEHSIEAFERLDMIETTKDGFINILGWEEYQNIDKLAEIREQTRKRVAKHREKQKLLGCNDTCNGDVTLRNGIEEEGEEDEEKESHSIIHSMCDDEKKYIEEKTKAEGVDEDYIDEYQEKLKKDLKMQYVGGSLGQGVLFMSDEQFENLCEMLTLDELHKYIDIVVQCELNGKKFKKKTHYQAILEMVAKDRKVK